MASRAQNRDDALVRPSLELSLGNEVYRHMNKLFPKHVENSKLWNRSDGLQQPGGDTSQTSSFSECHWSRTIATVL